jgi:hypothetical protein
MRTDDKVSHILENHEARVANLENMLTNPNGRRVTNDKKSLTDHIVDLRESGFFTEPRIADETHKKIKETYYCERNRVDVALLRLASQGLLRKTSKEINGKKYKAYVW